LNPDARNMIQSVRRVTPPFFANQNNGMAQIIGRDILRVIVT